jgi:hypothetical protein
MMLRTIGRLERQLLDFNRIRASELPRDLIADYRDHVLLRENRTCRQIGGLESGRSEEPVRGQLATDEANVLAASERKKSSGRRSRTPMTDSVL